LPVAVRFSARRAWLFFDISILSRRPFWFARVELARFARQLGNLQNLIFRCGLVRSGPPLTSTGWIGSTLIPFETLPPQTNKKGKEKVILLH